MRTTMNISLPGPLKTWIEQQVTQGGYSTASEYVREVLRHHQANHARTLIDARLTQAIDSGPSTPLTARDWKHIRNEGLKRAKRRAGK
jgi:antitoxin ParD1/3/4